jgi:flagellar FliL protein
MADEDEVSEDEAVEGEEGAEDAPKSKKLLFIILAVVLLGGGGAGAFFMLKGGDDHKTAAKKEEVVVPPIYVNLDPPFVVNFEAEAAVRFLQVTVSVMTRDPHIQEMLKNNDPRIRNDLLMLLSNQKYDAISTREGKEKLQTQSLEAVRAVVKSAGGEPEKLEALYFTAFVMQ